MDREILRHQQRLDHLFKKIGGIPDDLEMQSHWSRYLCVLVSGFIEVSVQRIYGQYARAKAVPAVANFVETELKYFQNPKMGKILELTKSFSAEWEEALRKKVEGERQDAVDSIVDNRNRIAHGQDVGISFVVVKRYYESVVKVIELINFQCENEK